MYPRYLHSAVLSDSLMLVFGGNTHNDTASSKGAKCFSADVMVYDLRKYDSEVSYLFLEYCDVLKQCFTVLNMCNLIIECKPCLFTPDCDTWYPLDAPKLRYDAARFGHNAHMRVSRDTTSNTFSYRMYIVGGFNGELLNDVLVYEPG